MNRIKKGDTLIIPGFGMMDHDFNFYVDAVRPFKVSTAAGLLSAWWPKKDFIKTGDHEWTHIDLCQD